MATNHQDPNPEPTSTVAARISSVVTALRKSRSSFGFVLSEIQPTNRIGDVMNAIKGLGGDTKYIMDGYQYVGGGPAHLWRLATADDQYKTMNYGITNFHEEWGEIRDELTLPYHYVSIGPGTGEKDQEVLRHLSSLSGDSTIVYVPVDISPQLLRIGLSAAMRGAKRDRVEALPMELDITSDKGLKALKIVVKELGSTAGVLVSLLGNTLANFRDPNTMLKNIGSLLSSDRDRLFLELATTSEATDALVKRAVAEYQGSDLFRQFAMAGLCDHTDLPRQIDAVISTGEREGDIIKITTSYQLSKSQRVNVGNSSAFMLGKGEPIELIVCRKYTEKALAPMLAAFERVAHHKLPYSDGFGSNMYLLAEPRRTGQKETPHPVAVMPTVDQ